MANTSSETLHVFHRAAQRPRTSCDGQPTFRYKFDVIEAAMRPDPSLHAFLENHTALHAVALRCIDT